MKIAVWHNLPSGGAKRALYNQVERLTARGHHLEAWCPPTADTTFLPLGELIREHVMPLALPGRTDWDKRLRVPARIERRIGTMDEHCRTCAGAIMSAGSISCSPILACSSEPHLSGVLSGFRRYLYLAEPYRALYEAQPRLPWLAPPPSRLPFMSLARLREVAMDHRTLHNARIQGREELQNVAAFDRILVNSLFSRENLLRTYGLDSEVCYLGTDLARFSNQGRPRERLVIGLGNYSVEKNLRLVIEALALLPAPRPVLAGSATPTTATPSRK